MAERDRDVTSEQLAPHRTDEQKRRRYEPPTVRFLGTVRNLTMASKAGSSEIPAGL